MRETENTEYLTAFVIGAVIGAGAALLLRPEPETTTEKVLKQLRPVARRAGKAARRAGKRYGRSFELSRDTTEELADAGREVLEDFRKRVDRIVHDASSDLSKTAGRKLREARKSLHRVRRAI
jgi:gas vesicle protein